MKFGEASRWQRWFASRQARRVVMIRGPKCLGKHIFHQQKMLKGLCSNPPTDMEEEFNKSTSFLASILENLNLLENFSFGEGW